MYHANAGPLLQGGNRQACYQTYYKYDLKKYLKDPQCSGQTRTGRAGSCSTGKIKIPTTLPVQGH